MSESIDPITVRRLKGADWPEFRRVRLAALGESPEAFSATLAEEEASDEASWLERVQRSPRFLAESGGAVVGMASLGRYQGAEGESENSGELYGLWVTPALRGTGVATALVNAASRQASDDGRSHVVYWVSTSNGRAVAFASGLGFRPTDDRRPMRGVGHADEEEIAMTLPLGLDRG